MNGRKTDIEPELDLADEDEDQSLPPPDTESTVETQPPLAAGRAAIAQYLKHAPATPGVYRMLDAAGNVIYVGKARNLKARVSSYTRLGGHTNRIARMIATTAAMEFVSVQTEAEALLLEANLIKRFRPRFNVLMRDDKSFPYILIARDTPAPQILKHRGARNRKGDYFGPFASAGAVNRCRRSGSSPFAAIVRQSTGQMSMQASHSMHSESVKCVCTSQFRHRSTSCRVCSAVNPSSTSTVIFEKRTGRSTCFIFWRCTGS